MICYDLRYQPLSIGDFVDYMEWSVLLGDPELCYSYDPAKPTIGDPGLSHIHAGNFAHYFKPFLSLCDNVIAGPVKYDYPAPQQRGQYMFYWLYNQVFSRGVKPIAFKSDAWAAAFLREHEVRYCIQIRNNPFANNSLRNTPMQTWKHFLQHRKERFVAIGDTQLCPRRDNVVIAKDFDTTIEQDLALAAACDIYLGPPSGPNGAVIFNGKPYHIFNATLKPGRCTAICDGTHDKAWWKWAKPHQRMTRGLENETIVHREFDRCLAAL